MIARSNDSSLARSWVVVVVVVVVVAGFYGRGSKGFLFEEGKENG